MSGISVQLKVRRQNLPITPSLPPPPPLLSHSLPDRQSFPFVLFLSVLPSNPGLVTSTRSSKWRPSSNIQNEARMMKLTESSSTKRVFFFFFFLHISIQSLQDVSTCQCRCCHGGTRSDKVIHTDVLSSCWDLSFNPNTLPPPKLFHHYPIICSIMLNRNRSHL